MSHPEFLECEGGSVCRACVVTPSPAAASTMPGILLRCSTEEMLIQTGQDALSITNYAHVDQT